MSDLEKRVEECWMCNGSGKAASGICPHCKGTGREAEEGPGLREVVTCQRCGQIVDARPAPADALRPPPIEAIRMLCGAAEHIDAIHIGSARRIVEGWLAALGEGAKEAEA